MRAVVVLFVTSLLGCHGDPVDVMATDAVADVPLDVVTTDAGTDAGDAGSSCPHAHGSEMARIDASAASYCIDVTEVTIGQFNEFVLAPGAPSAAPEFCTPFMKDRPAREITSDPTLPKGNMTWCWAYAYCAWAGKRLCSRIGRLEYDVPIDGPHSEWTYACQNGLLASKYPYGDTYQPKTCNTESGDVQSVTRANTCRGTVAPFDQVHDMLGNVAELDGYLAFDDAGVPVLAHTRGFSSLGVDRGCGEYDGFGPATPFAQVGFRCCDDP